jgi:hypothetical protein
MEGCCESMIKYFMFFINFLFALGKLSTTPNPISLPVQYRYLYSTGTCTSRNILYGTDKYHKLHLLKLSGHQLYFNF